VAGVIEVLQIIPQLVEEFARKSMAHGPTILPQNMCSGCGADRWSQAFLLRSETT
jgi:hypothetical protein